MGIAMISIILFHYETLAIPYISFIFFRFGHWGVDIFLFLSGWGCVFALEKHNLRRFYLRRALRILPKCLLAGSLILIIAEISGIHNSGLHVLGRLFSLNLWYVQAILVYYLFAPFIYTALKQLRFTALIVLTAIAIALGACTDFYGEFALNWIMWRFPIFIIGMYFAIFDFKPKPVHYWLSLVAFLCAVLIRIFYSQGPTQYYILALSIPFVCGLLCKLRKIAETTRLLPIVETIGVYSLEIYLIHEYILKILGTIEIPVFFKHLLFFSSTVVICYLLKRVADKWSLSPSRRPEIQH